MFKEFVAGSVIQGPVRVEFEDGLGIENQYTALFLEQFILKSKSRSFIFHQGLCYLVKIYTFNPR